MNSVVIVAAGSSKRMGFNKLLAPIKAKPVLQYTLEAFQKAKDIDQIVIVSTGETLTKAVEWQGQARYGKLTNVVEGGAERHFSVRLGLNLLAEGTTHVAVHDGARPLISEVAIERVFEVAKETGAASCAHQITDTVKRADAEGIVTDSIDRAGLWAMETPQVFDRALLLKAYDHVVETGSLVTDEVSAVEAIGHPVTLVENPTPNFKITFEGDLPMAEKFLA